MRWIVCLIPLLCACAAHTVRCDSHLQPINAPATKGAAVSANEIVPVRRTP